jgi:type I restriction enzyme M protein
MKRYAVLWSSFKERDFSYSDAFKALNEDKTINIVLSKLRTFGWLESKLDPTDARKRIYQLKKPEHAVEAIKNE